MLMERSYILRITGFQVGVFILLAFHLSSKAQVPNNTWRDHLSYLQASTIAISSDNVFCAMTTGGMLSYNKQNGEIQKHSKVNGLSDVSISSIAYSPGADLLIIGYKNGNIDLLTQNGLVNMPDIKRKRITGIKTIYQIAVFGTEAFLACGFGIVHLDLEAREVRDSYFFGAGGTPIIVNDVAILNDYIYAATESGIYKADLNAPNLVDFNFWNRLELVPQATENYKFIETFNNQVFAVYTQTDIDRIIRIDSDNSWNSWNPGTGTNIRQLIAGNNYISVINTDDSYQFNSGLELTRQFYIRLGNYLIADTDGRVYAASAITGFSYFRSDDSQVSVKVSNPKYNTTSNIFTQGDHVWIGSGGYRNPYRNGAAYNFYDEKWTSLYSYSTAGLGLIGNFNKFAFHPTKTNHVYASSYRYALYEIENYEIVKTHDLTTVPVFQQGITPEVGVRILGLDIDSRGNLWMVNEYTQDPVFVLRDDSQWEQLQLSSPAFNPQTSWRDLIVTENNQIWILSNRSQVIVLQELSDGSILEKQFSIKNEDGDLLSLSYSLTEDKDGNIWIGTNKGPIIYRASNRIFEDEEVLGFQPKIPRNDGSGLADSLLDYEAINAIAEDGGNRKWIATDTSGVFLVREDGKKPIHQFNTDNSPMISNTVLSVGVQENTGEVFISTDEGLIAFMGQATEGGEDFSDVYVYPNPVRPEYEGDITITGLIKDANVKITDISGNLVYETTSLGGQAIWDGRDFGGDRVQTGVYLVFLTNSDGSKTHITKLVFIH